MRAFVRTDDGLPLPAIKMLGEGGQGQVWQSTMDGQPVAIKIYNREAATPHQHAALARLIPVGAPDPMFLWPLTLVEDRHEGTFGYAMALLDKRFRPTEDFLARRVTPTFRVLLTACLNLANAFLRLHARGLSYHDISLANIQFDPSNGDVRIFDNDNVDIDGSETSGVAGTPRFMAPEIARRAALPSGDTDRYSLAVLIFHLLMVGHPLDGRREAKIRCMNPAAMEVLYGTDPLYIFDPADKSNEPHPDIHKNPIAFERIYPAEIKRLFLQSFTTGLRYPGKRVLESEWRHACEDAIDLIFSCQSCGKQNFYDPAIRKAGASQNCWRCKRVLVIPPRIAIPRKNRADALVVVSNETRLYGYHIGSQGNRDGLIAVVTTNPNNRSQIGLQNQTEDTWNLTRPDSTIVAIPPKVSAPVVSGNKIAFGVTTGDIEA